MVLESHSQQQFSAETGKVLNKGPVENMSLLVVHFNWNRSLGADEIGIPCNHSGMIYQGHESIGRIPCYLEWKEQAQIGGTHLFLMSTNHGVVIFRAPKRRKGTGSLDAGMLPAGQSKPCTCLSQFSISAR